MIPAEDNADRELVHELVRAAHPVWRTILATMREGVLVVDREMTVLIQNPAAAEIFPPPPISSRPLRLIDLTRDPALHEGFQQALGHGASVELRFELRRGEPRTFQVRIAPLRITADTPQAALGVFVEITALERLERVRRDFFANLSHELRTPLAAILAYVEMLQEIGWDDPEQVRRAAIEAGRDPDAIRFSVFTWRHPFQSEKYFYELVLAYRRAGFTDLIFPMPPEEAWPVLERCARTVIPELRQME